MAWLFLLVAGLCEIGWAIGLKYTEGFTLTNNRHSRRHGG
jgi:multidrug transporter EmrE-like cation transporter